MPFVCAGLLCAAAQPRLSPLARVCAAGDEQLMDQLAIDEDLPPLERLRTYSDSDIALQRCGAAPLNRRLLPNGLLARAPDRAVPLAAARLTSRVPMAWLPAAGLCT